MRHATIPRCFVLGHQPTPARLSRELSRFGVTELVVEPGVGFIAPLAATRARSVVGAPDRVLVCDATTFDGDDIGALLADAATDPDDCAARALIRPGAASTPGLAVIRRDFLIPGASLERMLAAADASGLPRQTIADPVPGFGARRPALFLDRDGTLNVDHGYVGTRERFDWIDGAREAVRLATAAGWHVFIVTNQSGVARGHFDETAVLALHDWMVDEIRRVGGTIDDVRHCPFHPDGIVPRYRAASDWRKPAPGMILDLIRAWDVDGGASVMVGDQASDVAAAAAAGVAGYLFPGGPLDRFIAPLLRLAAAPYAREAAD